MVAEPEDAEPEDVAEAEALAALRASPVVKAVKVLPARSGRLAGYSVDLWCRSGHAGGSKGELLRRTQQRLTGAAVCQDLLKLVTAKHSGQECLVVAERACATAAAAAAAAAAEPTPTPTPTAYAAMQAAARVPALAAAVEAAFANADAAASELEAAQAEALRLEEEIELLRETAQLPRKRQKEAAQEDNEYRAYSLRKFHELEKKEQGRRGLTVDRSQMDVTPLPRGNEQRGWRKHWRRGMHGALHSWAKGKLGAIVFMLAALTVDFGVVDEVCLPCGANPPLSSSLYPLMWQVAGELNLKLSKEEFENAKTDAYIISRIKSVLYVLKQCDSEVRLGPPTPPERDPPAPLPTCRSSIPLAHAAAMARPQCATFTPPSTPRSHPVAGGPSRIRYRPRSACAPSLGGAQQCGDDP